MRVSLFYHSSLFSTFFFLINLISNTFKKLPHSNLHTKKTSLKRQIAQFIICLECSSNHKVVYVPLFEPTKEGGVWSCPFCNPESTVYKLQVPPTSKAEKPKEVIINEY